MRINFALVLVTMFAGCGSSGGVAPDGAMDAGMDAGDDGFPPPAPGFSLVNRDVDVAPMSEVTFCYYFRTSNKSDMFIKKWASRMTAGTHDIIVYLTPFEQQTPGSLTTTQCGFSSNGVGPIWTYAAQTLAAESSFPADDGTGQPVGQMIKAGQPGFVQMHFINTTAEMIHPNIAINAYAYNDGISVTPAAPFVTFNTQINLAPAPSPSMPTTGMVNGNCNVAKDAKFYVVTTHTHKQGVHTFVKDGATTVFDSTSWEHPGTMSWNTAPFYSFTSGKLTYQCEYVNPNNAQIKSGDSAVREEACMAIAYYFPAGDDKGHYCLDSGMVY